MSGLPPADESPKLRHRERLRPPPVALDAGRARATGARRGLPAWVLALAILLTAAFFVMLPRWADRAGEAKPGPRDAPSPQPSKATAASAHEDAEERATQRASAARLLESAEAKRERLALRAPELWAAAEFARAGSLLEEGRELLSGDRPEPANEILASALAAYEQIEQGVGPALARELSAVRDALESADLGSATIAIDRAAAIALESADLPALRERVDLLPRVREQLERARVAELEHRWDAALAFYSAALAIDGATAAARRGLARVGGRQQEDRFQRAVAEAGAALDAEDLAAATDALERARALRPDAPELGALAKRLAGVATRKTSVLLAAQGVELEGRERWHEALAKHEEALALNPYLPHSLEARARCATRASLSRRIERHLSRTDRLSSTAVLDEARALLAEARAVERPGPEQLAQTARLAEAIENAATLVRVTLESDGQTALTIHHVGQLGAFQQRTLELRPGTYVVTGTRPGYRDVRRELVVKVGAPPPRLQVHCEERI